MLRAIALVAFGFMALPTWAAPQDPAPEPREWSFRWVNDGTACLKEWADLEMQIPTHVFKHPAENPDSPIVVGLIRDEKAWGRFWTTQGSPAKNEKPPKIDFTTFALIYARNGDAHSPISLHEKGSTWSIFRGGGCCAGPPHGGWKVRAVKIKGMKALTFTSEGFEGTVGGGSFPYKETHVFSLVAPEVREWKLGWYRDAADQVLKAWDDLEKEIPTHVFGKVRSSYDSPVRAGVILDDKTWVRLWTGDANPSADEKRKKVPPLDFTRLAVIYARPVGMFHGTVELLENKGEWSVMPRTCPCKGLAHSSWQLRVIPLKGRDAVIVTNEGQETLPGGGTTPFKETHSFPLTAK